MDSVTITLSNKGYTNVSIKHLLAIHNLKFDVLHAYTHVFHLHVKTQYDFFADSVILVPKIVLINSLLLVQHTVKNA